MKSETKKQKRPVVEYGDCSGCGGCIEVAPSVFSLNDLGFICIADALLEGYPEDEINEAIAMCPEDCIHWEEE